ncbi:hypothetical protein N7454_002990 [Penicillium verhagenii]|nr:hypothetical protein N7454_002990 [Penicillium verhagenii]
MASSKTLNQSSRATRATQNENAMSDAQILAHFESCSTNDIVTSLIVNFDVDAAITDEFSARTATEDDQALVRAVHKCYAMHSRFLEVLRMSPAREEALLHNIAYGLFKAEFALLTKHFAKGWSHIRKRALQNPRAAAIAQHWLSQLQIPNLPVLEPFEHSCIKSPRDFVRVARNTPSRELVTSFD